jgi:hypothetical protein
MPLDVCVTTLQFIPADLTLAPKLLLQLTESRFEVRDATIL